MNWAGFLLRMLNCFTFIHTLIRFTRCVQTKTRFFFFCHQPARPCLQSKVCGICARVFLFLEVRTTLGHVFTCFKSKHTVRECVVFYKVYIVCFYCFAQRFGYVAERSCISELSPQESRVCLKSLVYQTGQRVQRMSAAGVISSLVQSLGLSVGRRL